MQDQPNATELLEAVAQFLREKVMPQLDAHAAYHARVSANALDIVRRELELGRAAEAKAQARLSAILGRDGDLAELNRELCARITAGEIDLSTPGLKTHLWATTLDKLRIDQPSYASFRMEEEKNMD